jgi:hypothetical protein
MKELITYTWKDKTFTSQLRLNELFLSGNLEREIVSIDRYSSRYTYFKNGTEIASFINDNSFGLSDAATGVELIKN